MTTSLINEHLDEIRTLNEYATLMPLILTRNGAQIKVALYRQISGECTISKVALFLSVLQGNQACG